MKVVYIAHAYADDPRANHDRAMAWLLWAASRGDVAPVATWLQLTSAWPEDDASRDRGMAINRKLISRCDELWLCGRHISRGMDDEVEFARASGVDVVSLLNHSGWPPTWGRTRRTPELTWLGDTRW